MCHDRLYKDHEFQVYTKAGGKATLKGLYFICDGGYHHWAELQCLWKHTQIRQAHEWSKRLESVRKDVECCFGRLKGRFRILKLPCRFQKKETLDKVGFSCCVLHNMILEYDGLDDRWERGVLYDQEDGGFDACEAGELDAILSRNPDLARTSAGADYTSLGDSLVHDSCNVAWEKDPQHYVRKSELVIHYNIAKAKREVKWF